MIYSEFHRFVTEYTTVLYTVVWKYVDKCGTYSDPVSEVLFQIKDKTVDNVQNCDSLKNILLSQTYRFEIFRLTVLVWKRCVLLQLRKLSLCLID
jgi:hypothetical protein